jgi:XRE family transcriptional regulator, fatty acid utilization regulator
VTADPVRMAFADNLLAARQRAGLTQAQLAAASGVSQRHISALESGLSDPKLSTVTALATALGVKSEELLATA